jgi:hypothetical protein
MEVPMPDTAPKIVFVYAVDSGILNTVRDVLHKIVSPETYPCDLCALTYDPLREKPEWTCAVRSFPLRSEFLHRDELAARYPDARPALPAVLVDRDGRRPELLVSADEIGACKDADGLAALVRDRLASRAA